MQARITTLNIDFVRSNPNEAIQLLKDQEKLQALFDQASLADFVDLLSICEQLENEDEKNAIFLILSQSMTIQKIIENNIEMDDFVDLIRFFPNLATGFSHSDHIVALFLKKGTIDHFIEIIKFNSDFALQLAKLPTIQEFFSREGRLPDFFKVINENKAVGEALLKSEAMLLFIREQFIACLDDITVEQFDKLLIIGRFKENSDDLVLPMLAQSEPIRKFVVEKATVKEFTTLAENHPKLSEALSHYMEELYVPDNLIALMEKNPELTKFFISNNEDLQQIVIMQALPQKHPALFGWLESTNAWVQSNNTPLGQQAGLLPSDQYHEMILKAVGRALLLNQKFKIPFDDKGGSIFLLMGKLYFDRLNGAEPIIPPNLLSVFNRILDPMCSRNFPDRLKDIYAINFELYAANLENKSKQVIHDLLAPKKDLSFHYKIFHDAVVSITEASSSIGNDGEIKKLVGTVNTINLALNTATYSFRA